MRQYMLAICTLSIFYFALAAPVTVPRNLEVRSNAVDAFKDEIVVREKRRDLNPRFDSYESYATSQYHGPEDTVHGGYQKGYYPGNNDDSDSDDDSGSDDDNGDSNNNDSNNNNNNNNNNEDDEDETDNTNDDETDNESEHDPDDDPESDDDDPNDEGERDSYHGEHGNETPEHMSDMTTMGDFEELLGQFMHRARDSGFGAVGSQRGVAENR